MSLRSHSRVKESVVLTRADYLCIHDYIKITSKYYSKIYVNGPDEARTRDLLLACLTPYQLSHAGSAIYIYINTTT